jgi:hypothetical protein
LSRSIRLIVALALLIAVALSSDAFAAPGGKLQATSVRKVSTIKVAKSFTAKIAKSDARLLKSTNTKKVHVFVRLDYDPVASYYGGVKGLAATSPEATHRSLARSGAAVGAYQRYLSGYDTRVTKDMKATVAGIKVLRAHHIAFGGLLVQLPENRAKDLLKVDGVVAVMRDKVLQPQTNVTPEFLGATKVWPNIGGPIEAGDTVQVGVMDTGIWPEHESLLDLGLPPFGGGPLGCEFGDGSDPDLGDPFTCNDKLVGAYAFTDDYTSNIDPKPGEFCDENPPPGTLPECSARDSNGHGTHTSTTAGGDVNPDAQIFGVPKGTISGMAPGARMIMYRVCLDEGCFFDDMVSATEQAILDGDDVMNVSIGPFGPPYSDAVALAFLDAYASGMLVSVSAGNSGPGAGTSSDPGPWAVTVGASTSPRFYETTLHVTADNGDTFTAPGTTITDGIANATDVVDAATLAGYNDALCQSPLPASVAGLIVACQRGTNARVNKSYNISLGGGAGMILYNVNANQDTETDNHWVPAVHLGGASDGIDYQAFMQSHTGLTATWDAGAPVLTTPDAMAAFSSRGPVGDFIKPDVTAPGVQILAGHTPEPILDSADGTGVSGPPGEFYQAIAGTSMSSPHDAGISALVKASHPDWTPGEIKSAIMLTAKTNDVFKEDAVTPADPFDMGNGSIRADRAADSTLVMDVPAADYFAGGDGSLTQVDLNYPSINVNPLPGGITTPRTFTNASDDTVTYKLTGHTDDANVKLQFFPNSFTLAPGDSATVDIRMKFTGTVTPGQHFGRVDLNPQGGVGRPGHLQVAFIPGQGSVGLLNRCASHAIAVGGSTSCVTQIENNNPVETDVHAELVTNGSIVRLGNVVGATSVNNHKWTFDGTLGPAAAPTVDDIVTGGTGFGYVSLASLGVPPLADQTDESITNISWTGGPIRFGGEAYTEAGIVSNGYVVLGGGDASDVDFMPQTLPDVARPNNVMAGFWTDLNPEAGGAMYASGVTDGTNDWIVFEWENVPTYTQGDPQTFQIWLLQNGEGNTFEYGDLTGSGDPVGLTVGAENRLGSSGVNLGSVPADGSEYTILASPAQGGGTVTITYDASGQGEGTQHLDVKMDSDLVRGKTVSRWNVTVS